MPTKLDPQITAETALLASATVLAAQIGFEWTRHRMVTYVALSSLAISATALSMWWHDERLLANRQVSKLPAAEARPNSDFGAWLKSYVRTVGHPNREHLKAALSEINMEQPLAAAHVREMLASEHLAFLRDSFIRPVTIQVAEDLESLRDQGERQYLLDQARNAYELPAEPNPAPPWWPDLKHFMTQAPGNFAMAHIISRLPALSVCIGDPQDPALWMQAGPYVAEEAPKGTFDQQTMTLYYPRLLAIRDIRRDGTPLLLLRLDTRTVFTATDATLTPQNFSYTVSLIPGS